MIISIFSFAHSAIALTLANTAFGDTIILTALTFWMIQMIGSLYDCNDINPWKIMGKVVGFCAGTYIGGKLLFWLPGIGNWANATATFIVTQTIGWTCVFLMESFDDPSKATDADWDEIMAHAKSIGSKQEKENKALLKKMSREEKECFKKIHDQLRSGDLSSEDKKRLFAELARMKETILNR